MNNSKSNIFSEIDFCKFAAPVEEAVKDAVENYWELDNIRVKTNAVNNFRDFREEEIISKTNFFSSQVRVQNHRPVIFRLSEEFTDNILTKVLKSNSNSFNLHVLTELEVKILNNFCEFLYKKLDTVLLPTNEVKITEQSDKNVNIILLISTNEDECSKLMLSIPKDRLKFEQLNKTASFKDENFLTSHSIVKIKAGSSRITLDELKNLSTEDIILLENSNSSKMTLISGELVKEFGVKPDPSLLLNIKTDDQNDDENNTKMVLTSDEVTMEKNLWDDIQIEINAEFEKVKMTIGELKQITQGQIVDLGSVFDNEISLFVEDKIVAKGELVIINDKYAVKLNKVFSPKTQISKPAPAPAPAAKPAAAAGAKPLPPKPAPKPAAATATAAKPAAKPAPKPAPAPSAKPAPKPAAAQTEDFDYSDFEK